MIGFRGAELSLDPSISSLERLYIRCLGVPINGLRIRLRRVFFFILFDLGSIF